jgi:C-terminal processing protease CtpA/Prc
LLLTNTPASATPTAEAGAGPSLGKSTTFDENYGYLRVARVASGLAGEVTEAISALSASNRLKGLVLDLRFAGGSDYAAAAEVADRFVAEEKPLLAWGDGKAQSTAKTNAFGHPVVVLVNAGTSGASEGLAAALRAADAGLLIGATTAGSAAVFEEFSLKNGQRLRIASKRVQAGENQVLPLSGIVPDIAVSVGSEDEKQYFADAYKVIARPAARTAASTNLTAAATNRPTRINEAELVRMRREGIDPEAPARSARAEAQAKPVVTDPALARGLDLLKALAVVRKLK